jgi:hypothetical protein
MLKTKKKSDSLNKCIITLFSIHVRCRYLRFEHMIFLTGQSNVRLVISKTNYILSWSKSSKLKQKSHY